MCDCNDSQFKKLRDNWSRYTKGSQPCQCCQVPKAKTKGKFGVAYVIETPNRKCKPCGWEIEFTDTPSTIENNCKKIMNWITCPPLGECQNANTTVCCCSPPAKGVCTLNQACCPPKNESCCRSKNNYCCDSGRKPGGCCCTIKKPPCCCSKCTDPKPCCSKPRNPCCCKKPKSQCCANRCPPCDQRISCSCCPSPPDDAYCCQVDSDSDDCCCCNQTKADCGCKCNCSACKCNGKKNSHPKKRDVTTSSHQVSKNHSKSKDAAHKGTVEAVNKPSKNLHSLETTGVKMKGSPRSPYTISVDYLPRKGPDKDDEVVVIKTPPSVEGNVHKSEEFADLKRTPTEKEEIESIVDYRGDSKEIARTLTETSPYLTLVHIINKIIKALIYIDTFAPKDLVKTGKQVRKNRLGRNPSSGQSGDNEQPKRLPPIKPPRKRLRGAALLRKIKEEHRKEMEAIHGRAINDQKAPAATGDDSVLIGSDDLTIKTNETSGEIPGVRKRLKKGLGKKLLEQIHKKHREEMEAIHHLEPPKNELNQEKPTESLNEYYFSAQNDLNKVESNVIYPE